MDKITLKEQGIIKYYKKKGISSSGDVFRYAGLQQRDKVCLICGEEGKHSSSCALALYTSRRKKS